MTAEQEIRRLVDGFADAITRGEFSSMPDLWTDDGTWWIGPPGDFRTSGNGEHMTEVIRERSRGWEWFIQLVHHGVVEVDAGTARARWYLTEMGSRADGGPDYFNYGMYDDELALTPHGWRFRSRAYHYLYLDRTALHGEGWRPPYSTRLD